MELAWLWRSFPGLCTAPKGHRQSCRNALSHLPRAAGFSAATAWSGRTDAGLLEFTDTTTPVVSNRPEERQLRVLLASGTGLETHDRAAHGLRSECVEGRGKGEQTRLIH